MGMMEVSTYPMTRPRRITSIRGIHPGQIRRHMQIKIMCRRQTAEILVPARKRMTKDIDKPLHVQLIYFTGLCSSMETAALYFSTLRLNFTNFTNSKPVATVMEGPSRRAAPVMRIPKLLHMLDRHLRELLSMTQWLPRLKHSPICRLARDRGPGAQKVRLIS